MLSQVELKTRQFKCQIRYWTQPSFGNLDFNFELIERTVTNVAQSICTFSLIYVFIEL